ncbi:MAG: L-glutamate gamma-semialdehyde dehydrogenase [Thermoanaerobaculia bacterium]|nr:MAG: L-glutamate gamma-semialdehyde dehydrogenase [Thermoanaerobaculia bacterium]
MLNGIVRVPVPVNEPVRNYAPGSPERAALKLRLAEMLAETVDIPLVIGGREVRTGKTLNAVCPHDHGHVLATCHQAGPKEIEQAIAAARAAWRDWSEMPREARAAVFLKAADLLAGPWRDTVNAATMLGQSKNAFQAEIDAAAELADFWRFNPYFAEQLYADQPLSVRGIWDYVEYRALEGFVFAVTPFNFTSIGGNLPAAPALMGNAVLWKPASTSILSNYYVLKVLEAAGLPPGVINFVPGRGGSVGDPVFASPEFSGLHFTGSTETFQRMWGTIAGNLAKYKGYPRIVGETGGKDFVFAHPSADARALVVALVRGSFEYQGQKCSAASRAYVPASLWKRVREELVAEVAALRMGAPTDFRNFMCAVIDEASFDKTMEYIGFARASASAEIVVGGGGDKTTGYFVEPTVVRTDDPRFRLMQEEIFAPVLTLYVYDDARLEETLELCDTTSPYSLTGAVFAQDRAAIVAMTRRLRHAAGNFYVNDKPTGAVVGQQPFGGARASGTNDKAGSLWNLVRWVNVRAIKENFVPPTEVAYPHQSEA